MKKPTRTTPTFEQAFKAACKADPAFAESDAAQTIRELFALNLRPVRGAYPAAEKRVGEAANG